ncbi:hypothetical protein OsJ_36015 [Oryza sativa Japonica Group]|uniref:Uncharacterized protein n=1 Tax=Oryza sativa subsp. japonica TaxID=39947 RepID=A3CH44_ORYSJ|nr:hypothetical protein OsJ_36015 [Oryza sativa Japonica Group]
MPTFHGAEGFCAMLETPESSLGRPLFYLQYPNTFESLRYICFETPLDYIASIKNGFAQNMTPYFLAKIAKTTPRKLWITVTVTHDSLAAVIRDASIVSTGYGRHECLPWLLVY